VGQAAVWGFGRTLAREQQHLACTLVDLPPDASRADLDLLREELLGADDGENQIALRDGTRQVARLAPHEVPPARASAADHDGGPQAFLAAYYALTQLTAVKPGERVLVRGGETPAGMAAIQISRWQGAQVLTTAQTPVERAFLQTLGAQRVLRPGDLSDDVRFEVIVDAGGEQAAGRDLSLLAPYGRYVDVAPGPARSRPAGPPNHCYFTVDAGDLIRARPRRAAELLTEIRDLTGAGIFKPLPGDHAGAGAAPASGAGIRADATYLITGGLGGVGQEVARWLAASGARHLLLVGRTPLAGDGAGSAKARAIAELEQRGVRVTYRAADVADEAAMRNLLREHSQQGRPAIRGVVHAAGLVVFEAVADLDPGELTALLRPKLAGGWLLHRLFEAEPLDFFVLFSSASAVLASPQLSAYAAANAVLDAIAHTRRAAGLPAVSVNWGYWSAVGMGARYADDHGRQLAPRGMDSFAPDEAISVLARLLAAPPVQVTVLAADWPRWSAAHPEAARDPLLRELVPATASDQAPAGTEQAPAGTEQAPAGTAQVPAGAGQRPGTANGLPGDGTGQGDSRDAVRAFVTGVVARSLKLPADRLNVRSPLIDEGMDSLMATELRREVQQACGVNVSVTRMLHGLTLAELADFIADELGKDGDVRPASGGARA
jgi:NADPH:quinone reductase-like Zn-dependent oxidoreductase/acyl carrier protein